jgi:hypothetical protein
MTASPMNFSTDPPCRSTMAAISSKNRDMTRRRDSASRRSPSPVEPVTSANNTVTVLRTSRTGASTSNCRPQAWQKRARSAFGSPQAGQVLTPAV